MSDVSTIADEFLLQRRDMALASDLMGGTPAMRRAGQAYIPRTRKQETDEEYNSRVERTVLLNAYKRTIRYLKGQVFKKPVFIEDTKDGDLLGQEGVDWFNQWAEDVDHAGANLTEWAGNTFESGINAGVVFCLVDYSRVDSFTAEDGSTWIREADGSARIKTAQADSENGFSPYLVMVPADRVLDAKAETIGGKRVVTHFRYIEDFFVPKDEWTKERRQRIRCFWPGRYAEYEFYVGTDGKVSSTGVPTAEGEMRDESGKLLDCVPLAVFMPGEKRTEFTAEPALQDLAYLNLRHWQATAAQSELMEFVRRPVWFGKMLTENANEPIPFGPGFVLSAGDEAASLISVGVDPQSVEAGRSELKDLEERMALYGLQLLQPGSSASVTATEVMQDAEESVSTLQEWAQRFQNFLENCLLFASMWKGWPDGPSVKVNTDLTRPVSIETLSKLFDAGAISRQTLLEQCKRANILPDDFDVDEEPNRIAQELNAGGGAAGTFNMSNIFGGQNTATAGQ